MLYLSVAFVVLIPTMYHYVVVNSLPKSILLFVIPAYVVMAMGFYSIFKGLKPR